MNEKKIYLDACSWCRPWQFNNGSGNWTEERKKELAGVAMVILQQCG